MKAIAWVCGAMLFVLGLLAIVSLSIYNTIQRRDEAVGAKWAVTLSVYQKRADLVPNLVATVERYASHEQNVLTETAKARAAAGQTKIALPENATDEQLAKFAEAQRELSASIARLLAVAESYPNLKADQLFIRLQQDLKEVEGQATVARNSYIREVRDYNFTVRSWQAKLAALLIGAHNPKPQLQFENPQDLQRSPRVTFSPK